MSRKDIAGERFGMLVATKPVSVSKWKSVNWEFACDCGGTYVGVISSGRNIGHCGCQTNALLTAKLKTHGRSKTRMYKSWAAMKDRCSNPNNTHYEQYGARGISVCERWMSFEMFLEDMGERPEECTLERKDNSRGYEPDNCIWATRTVQQRNRRACAYYTINDRTCCLAEWCDEYGIKYQTVKNRLRKGRSIEEALTEPVQEKFRNSLCKKG